jgi:N-acetylmuramoyl-L-alanine amidase
MKRMWMVTVGGKRVYWDATRYRTFLVTAETPESAMEVAQAYFSKSTPRDLVSAKHSAEQQVWVVNVERLTGDTLVLDAGHGGVEFDAVTELLNTD